MALTAARLLTKLGEAHRKINGAIGACSIVGFTLTRTSAFVQPQRSEVVTPISIPPLVYDQPPEELVPAFGPQIAVDEKIFVFVVHSLVTAQPLSTVSQRARAFLQAKSGLENGCIRYDGVDYSIIDIKPATQTPVLGIFPQFAVHAKASAVSINS